jgi:hypothetical protein
MNLRQSPLICEICGSLSLAIPIHLARCDSVYAPRSVESIAIVRVFAYKSEFRDRPQQPAARSTAAATTSAAVLQR